MLTISQFAGYAGVTVRTVRHYHACGLLPEPPRDTSGYRRYAADDVVALVRIKTLAASGVPLAKIQELLRAGPAQFTAALAEIDAELGRKIAELRRNRADLARLPSAERLCVPDAVARQLDRMREFGASERTIAMERDSWILLGAAFPEVIEETLEWRRRSLDDPAYRSMMLQLETAFDWDPDDPRLAELADAVVEMMLRVYPIETAAAELQHWEAPGSERYRLVAQHNLDASPAWKRLSRLVEIRAREAGYPMP